MLKAVQNSSQIVMLNIKKATGGIALACAEAITKDPVGSAEKLKNLDAQSGPLAKVKKCSNRIFKKPWS
jgi:hypothetical protein